ncbi:hypothetical protein SAMN02927900_04844 [Rhizobium mongolense subsp. loessense]|uniref:DUF3307 domain-containing protein n=1 Tax=Rhizobium mongolense subsp. loessense TaxID=158890 RepID=A0A1G4T871_9HYPH|nr:hypothetical protein [Rhizobium mongolense]SCW77624.1 hypothetical protein SAMN02927900_04844 [Rhizobium mongolense subsp. loessense]
MNTHESQVQFNNMNGFARGLPIIRLIHRLRDDDRKYSDAGADVARRPFGCAILSDAKQSGPLRVYHLIAHSGIQGTGVTVVTGSVWLGLIEWTAHAIIDEAKVSGKTTFAQNQALHIVCKIVWLAYLVLSATLLHGPSISLWWR